MAETLVQNKRDWKITAGALAATLALVGCTSESTTEAANTSTSQPTEAPGSSNSPINPGYSITIDALGGGTPDVFLYAGPGESAADKATVAKWLTGDVLAAECKTEGRTVSSDPNVGEEARTSNMWVRVANPDEDQYATAVYIENPEEALSKLPDC